jgi:uncharacterized protein
MHNINIQYLFEWDLEKELFNARKHKIMFHEAMEVFADPHVIHMEDNKHSQLEQRFYAVGKTFKGKIITVRYALRGQTIRIFGAAKWRKWRRFYERENSGSK